MVSCVHLKHYFALCTIIFNTGSLRQDVLKNEIQLVFMAQLLNKDHLLALLNPLIGCDATVQEANCVFDNQSNVFITVATKQD